MQNTSQKPRWIRDLLRFLPLKSQFVLSGNVRDQYPLRFSSGAPAQVLPLIPYVSSELREAGVNHFLSYDPADGFSLPVVMGSDRNCELGFFRQLGLPLDETGRAAASPERFF